MQYKYASLDDMLEIFLQAEDTIQQIKDEIIRRHNKQFRNAGISIPNMFISAREYSDGFYIESLDDTNEDYDVYAALDTKGTLYPGNCESGEVPIPHEK